MMVQDAPNNPRNHVLSFEVNANAGMLTVATPTRSTLILITDFKIVHACDALWDRKQCAYPGI